MDIIASIQNEYESQLLDGDDGAVSKCEQRICFPDRYNRLVPMISVVAKIQSMCSEVVSR